MLPEIQPHSARERESVLPRSLSQSGETWAKQPCWTWEFFQSFVGNEEHPALMVRLQDLDKKNTDFEKKTSKADPAAESKLDELACNVESWWSSLHPPKLTISGSNYSSLYPWICRLTEPKLRSPARPKHSFLSPRCSLLGPPLLFIGLITEHIQPKTMAKQFKQISTEG